LKKIGAGLFQLNYATIHLSPSGIMVAAILTQFSRALSKDMARGGFITEPSPRLFLCWSSRCARLQQRRGLVFCLLEDRAGRGSDDETLPRLFNCSVTFVTDFVTFVTRVRTWFAEASSAAHAYIDLPKLDLGRVLINRDCSATLVDVRFVPKAAV
jgi:hypothetical protein